MPTINYTAEQINALLAKAGESASQDDLETMSAELTEIGETVETVSQDVVTIDGKIGVLSNLSTTAKGNTVAAINETFQSASEVKTKVAAAITGKGVSASATETGTQLAAKINQLQPPSYVNPSEYVKRLITNDTAITPTGSYATSTYYNTTFGVKVSYAPNGDIVVTMKGGTSTTYENLIYTLTTSISGVTLSNGVESAWSDAVAAGHIYSCIISGLTVPATIQIAMGSRNSTYDTVTCAITLTAVS